MTYSHTGSQDIELVLPGGQRYISLARLLAGGVATMYGLTLVQVRDTRLVIEEMCLSLMEIGQGCPVTVTISIAEGRIVLWGRTEAKATPDPARAAARRRLLDMLATDHESARMDGYATVMAVISAAAD